MFLYQHNEYDIRYHAFVNLYTRYSLSNEEKMSKKKNLDRKKKYYRKKEYFVFVH